MEFIGPESGDCTEAGSGLALMTTFVGYGQALAAFGTTTSDYAAAVSGFHTRAETVLVAALALRGLKSTFHGIVK